MKIQLKRSNVLQDGSAKEPSGGQMEYGELAVNYNETDPAIFIKDSNNNIIRIAGADNIADDGTTNVPSGDTPPLSPAPQAGNLWFNDVEGRLYIYYVDADSSQWVDASPDSWDNAIIPDTGIPGEQPGTLDDRYVSKVATTSQDMAGDLTFGTNKITLDASSGDVTASKFIGDGSQLTNVPYPVTSVNTKTGAVVLSAADVGALASGDNVSELTNDAGYITASDIPPTATPTLQSVTDQGSNTTNNITLATDKIVLNASGTAEFAGGATEIQTTGNQQWGGTATGTKGSLVSVNGTFYATPSSGTEAYLAYNEGSSTPTVTIRGDGNATFSGKLNSAGYRIDQLTKIESI